MKYSYSEYSFPNDPNNSDLEPAKSQGIPNYSTPSSQDNNPFVSSFYHDVMGTSFTPFPSNANMPNNTGSQTLPRQTMPGTTSPFIPSRPNVTIPAIPSVTAPNTPTMPLSPGTVVPTVPSNPGTISTPPFRPGTMTAPMTPGTMPNRPSSPSTPTLTMPGTPGSPMPRSTMPGMTTPSFTVPSTTMPRSTMPGMTMPRSTMPGMTMPSSTMPGMTMPGSTMPGMTMPSSTMPGMTMPGSTMPGMTMPSSTMPGMTMPGSTMPGMTMPRSTMPGMTVPRTTMPGTTLPGSIPPVAPMSNSQQLPPTQNIYPGSVGSSKIDYDYSNLGGFGPNGIYMSNITPYHVPLGVPMMPLYGYDNCEDADKDTDYMKQMYPITAKKMLAEINEECDKLEYDGSCMFDEYPDRVYLSRIVDKIYAKCVNIHEQSVSSESLSTIDRPVSDEVYLQSPSKSALQKENYVDSQGKNELKDLTEVLLYNEMLSRRRRYRSRKRWF